MARDRQVDGQLVELVAVDGAMPRRALRRAPARFAV
jgi:hypothetical protein